MGLILNITSNDIGGDIIANTSDKIAVVPEFSRPEGFPKLGELFEYFSCRYAFHYLHYFSRRVPGRGFDKYMDMVFHHFHGIYVKAILFSDMPEDFFYVSGDVGIKYMLPVFGNPHQMVFEIIDRVFRPSNSHAILYNNYRLSLAKAWRALRGHFHPASKLAGIQWSTV